MINEDIKLPKEIKASDLKYPSWELTKKDESNRYVAEFGLWYTERFGWCIPTLLISKAKRTSNVKDRTYGVTMEGEVVTMGKGPHILKTVTVYVKKNRQIELQKFLDLKLKGEQKAGSIRDSISTRRARTAERRMAWGGGPWDGGSY